MLHQPHSWDWDGNERDDINVRALNNVHSGSAPSLAGFSFDQHDGSQNFPQTKDVNIENKLESGESNLMVTRLSKNIMYIGLSRL